MRESMREALRSLRTDRRFTAVAIALLAVTIGIVAAVYAIVLAIVLRPFPFTDQDRLVVLWQRDDRRAQPIIEVAYGEMTDWRSRSRSVEDLAVVGSVNWTLSLEGGAGSQPVSFAAVSASFFHVVGAQPVLGRSLSATDEDGTVARVMVISDGLWARRFGRDAAIIGRAVPVRMGAGTSSVPVEIVGVMPAEFDYPRGADAWLPAAPEIRRNAGEYGIATTMRWLRVFYAVGRLRHGVSVEAATRELTHVMRTADMQGGPEPPSHIVVTPIATHLLGPAEPVLWTLLGGAVLMLGIACANVAGLQISRSVRIGRALAIRIALGASRPRIAAQTLLESMAITTCAATAGAVIAAGVVRGLVLLAPEGVPRLSSVTLLDTRVLLIGIASSFLTMLGCGVWPAAAAGRVDVASILAHGPRIAADRRGRRLQRAIIIAQIAAAVTLLAGSALFLRTLRGLERTTLGFDPEGLTALSVTPQTDDLQRWNLFYAALLNRLERAPGVTCAGAVLLRPLKGPVGWDSQPIFPGQVPEDPATWGLNPHVNLEVVTPAYFRTMGIRLVRGRLFTAHDTLTSPGVVVIGESAAKRLWPTRDALGQRLRDPAYRVGTNPARSAPGWQTVVGIVEDVRYRGLSDVRLDLYVPAAQSWNRVHQVMVRARGTPGDVAASVRAVAHEIDQGAAISDAVAMTDVVAAESAPWRFLLRIFIAFAAIAAVLAAVGLGAVIALAVGDRRRELAIRAALGARRHHLRATVVREGFWLVGAGIALGLVAALVLGRAIAHVLVGIPPHDALALGCAASLSAAVGVLASWLPARSAQHADPIEALRAE
jgi:putative ABC transport system permease protein